MKEVVAKIPTSLQPMIISRHVIETCVGGENDQICMLDKHGPCALKDQLRAVLRSDELFIAIVGIVEHYNRKVDDVMRQAIRRLASMEVSCMQKLQTVLQLEGKNVVGSEADVRSFIRNDDEILVVHNDDKARVTIANVAMKLNQSLENILEVNGVTILSILLSEKSPDSILTSLSEFGIDVKEDFMERSDYNLPPPGSTIPNEIYNLIEQDIWTSFQEGDYVAYAKSEGNDDYYVYARIIKHKSGESLEAVYLIDVGTDTPLEASVVDIHKIHIPKPVTDMSLVPAEQKLFR